MHECFMKGSGIVVSDMCTVITLVVNRQYAWRSISAIQDAARTHDKLLSTTWQYRAAEFKYYNFPIYNDW